VSLAAWYCLIARKTSWTENVLSTESYHGPIWCRCVSNVAIEIDSSLTRSHLLGKSTLLDLLSGRKRFDAGGKVSLNGRTVKPKDMKALS
jgi:hypothetical protein